MSQFPGDMSSRLLSGLYKPQKYVFVTNFEGISPAPDCSKANPPCSYMPFRQSFKKGDIVEGTMIVNNVNSEPPNFIVVNGGIRVPFGGRGSQIIQSHSTTGIDIPIGKPLFNTLKPTTQNILVGILVLAGIYGLYKITNK